MKFYIYQGLACRCIVMKRRVEIKSKLDLLIIYEFVKSYLLMAFLFILIYGAIAVMWRYYEIITIGHVEPNAFDTVVAIVLTISIILNIQIYKTYKEMKIYIKAQQELE